MRIVIILRQSVASLDAKLSEERRREPIIAYYKPSVQNKELDHSSNTPCYEIENYCATTVFSEMNRELATN